MKRKSMAMSTREVRIVRLPEVMRMTGLGESTIHRRYRDGTFPRPLRLGAKAIGWRREEVLESVELLPRVGVANGEVRDGDRGAG